MDRIYKMETEEEQEQEVILYPIQRIDCRLCCPIQEGYPHIFLILFVNDIQLNDPNTLNHATWIALTTHPLGLLYSINQHPKYIQYPHLHKHLAKNYKWAFQLVIGPFTPLLSDFQRTRDILQVKKQWEQKSRKVLTRLLWGVTFWNQYKDQGLNCYIDTQGQTLVTRIMNHPSYSPNNLLNIKSIYEDLLRG